MKLYVYKGFDKEFLQNLKIQPLVDSLIEVRQNIFSYNSSVDKKLDQALLNLESGEEAWVLYEEFSLLKDMVETVIERYGLEIIIVRNNLYPDYFPIPFEMEESLVQEVINVLNGDNDSTVSEKCQKYISIYNSLFSIQGTNYGSYYNYEHDWGSKITTENFYNDKINIEPSDNECEYSIFLNEDVETYLRDLENVKLVKPKTIGRATTGGEVSERLLQSLQAYCVYHGIKLCSLLTSIPKNDDRKDELIAIARDVIKIPNFTDFRRIKFYQNPDIDKEIIEISQGQIIQEIIHQAEKSYDDSGHTVFRDIFITASTGAGKSLMFQIPAIYLAQKYGKLTLIIEPVKALMQDQKEKLHAKGYTRVEAFNSDLITQVEKEAVIEKVKNGEIDLLYLSPESLLSYSLETIIGDREVGLLIVDEAHIVTTWGIGFRPDYWYLGGYINKLRNHIQTTRGRRQRKHQFPICAFTATAINGGVDDSVSDTIISLYMENPIKYIGHVRRDNIEFDVVVNTNNERLSKQKYEEKKRHALSERISQWLEGNEKTLVYFPFATQVYQALHGTGGFAGIIKDNRIGSYTGRNVDGMQVEAFNDQRRTAFERFRDSTTPIMFATKAFGMGVDVDDVKNVYHYAVTGNLCDYVQEIGRAARNQSIRGLAITDTYGNDLSFMKMLFGMSQIRQFQIRQVLHGIYEAYKSKNEVRNFLISPESFTYIFSTRGKGYEGTYINKLKTCLLMLEKDFYDKYNFKVLISRPQSVFTKAFICIFTANVQDVLDSKYRDCFTFIQAGRVNELQSDGSRLSDMGDIYSIDLKKVWENFYANISFPQFKYWYFNSGSNAANKIDIMPEVRKYFAPRQKVNIETREGLLLSELRSKIFEDFKYISNALYNTFRKQYFSAEEFSNLICRRFGKASARMIANSIFDLVDPTNRCVKFRSHENTGKITYHLSNGNFNEFMRRPISKSSLVNNISRIEDSTSYSSYLSLMSDEDSALALKLLSLFNYLTYEIVGGEEPEIFIRLNDPNKIRNIVLGNTYYSNDYVTKAKQKHDRDVEILIKFFNTLQSNDERWDFIENYFLGHDMLSEDDLLAINPEKMIKVIDIDRSVSTSQHNSWIEIEAFFDKNESVLINKLADSEVRIPEYLDTVIKKTDMGEDIIMSWPSKDVLICQQETSNNVINSYKNKGWTVYRLDEIDPVKIKAMVN